MSVFTPTSTSFNAMVLRRIPSSRARSGGVASPPRHLPLTLQVIGASPPLSAMKVFGSPRMAWGIP